MKALLPIALAILLTGCASHGSKINTDYATSMVKGETTQADALKHLGKPVSTAKNSSGDTILTYLYVKSKAKASTFIPIAGAFMGGANTETSYLIATFDRDGILKDWSYTESSTETNTGLTAN